MTEKKNNGWIVLLILVLVISLVTWLARPWLVNRNVDVEVVLIGNLVLFFASLLSYWYYQKAMKSVKGYHFAGKVYAGFVIKFFIIIAAALVYFAFSDDINQNAIFILFGLYLIYSFAGTHSVTKKPAPAQTRKASAKKK